MALRIASAADENPRQPNLYLIHGGPGAQGTLHGLAASLPPHLNPREILQSYAAEKPLSVQVHIDDMARIIRRPANILGHSWGAMLALSFACQHPHLCNHVVLVGCGTYSKTSRAEYERRIAARTDIAHKNQLKEAIHNAATEEEREKAFKTYGDYATSIQAFEPISDPYPDPEPKYDQEGHRQTWLDAMRLQEEGIEPARFASITCPVTLIQGKQDPHPGHLIRDDLLPSIPQLDYIELDQCGHEPWLERHARTLFLNLIEKTLNKV